MATITGGNKMDKALAEIARKIGKARSVRIGFLEGATYPDDAHTPVATVAAYLNYGTSRMPPRPFFSQMVAKKSPKWGTKLRNVLKAADYDTKRALTLMGAGIKDQLINEIVAFNDPPDSEATMARKRAAGKENATLIDTKHMLKSVDFEVSDEPA